MKTARRSPEPLYPTAGFINNMKDIGPTTQSVLFHILTSLWKHADATLGGVGDMSADNMFVIAKGLSALLSAFDLEYSELAIDREMEKELKIYHDVSSDAIRMLSRVIRGDTVEGFIGLSSASAIIANCFDPEDIGSVMPCMPLKEKVVVPAELILILSLVYAELMAKIATSRAPRIHCCRPVLKHNTNLDQFKAAAKLIQATSPLAHGYLVRELAAAEGGRQTGAAADPRQYQLGIEDVILKVLRERAQRTSHFHDF